MTDQVSPCLGSMTDQVSPCFNSMTDQVKEGKCNVKSQFHIKSACTLGSSNGIGTCDMRNALLFILVFFSFAPC